MATIVDSYSESNEDTNTGLYPAGFTLVGQSFTGDGSILNKSVFYLKKLGLPTGNATSKIYQHSGTFGSTGVPTGAPLAVSNNFDVSTLSTTYALIDFTFTGLNKITLSNGIRYVVTIEYNGGDGSNVVLLGIDTTSPTHNGNSCYGALDDIPGVSSDDTWDIPFYIYRDDISSISPSTSPSQSPSVSISPSVSPSISVSISPSISRSISPSTSPSVSVSTSPSISQSVSPSQSPSASISPSVSPSVSVSISPSTSHSLSPSTSPSVSQSLSPSISVSISPSTSPSISPSTSPSQSPSASISPSISPSVSQSLSPSASPSISPSISIPLKPHGWVREFKPQAKLASVTPRATIE